MIGQISSYQLKKQAIQNNMRKKWLQTHFQTIRDSMVKSEQHENEICQTIREYIDQLPQKLAIINLVGLIDKHKNTVIDVVFECIELVSDKMVRIGIVQWMHYVYLINTVIGGHLPKKDIQKVVDDTLLTILQCGSILANEHKNNIINYKEIMDGCLNYFYKISFFLLTLDGMQQNILFAVLQKLWLSIENVDNLEDYTKLLIGCNNMLTNSFDQDDLENVSPQKLSELENMRLHFIVSVFYSNNCEIIRIFLKKSFYEIVSRRQEDRSNIVFLELICNMTIYLNKDTYYYPFIKYQLVEIINYNLINHADTLPIMIFTIRLLNNMLVNEPLLSQTILEQLCLSKMMEVYGANQHNLYVQIEFVEMITNLIYFLNTDHTLIRKLVTYGAHIFILQLLAKIDSPGENFILMACTAIYLAKQYSPIQVSNTLRHFRETLIKVSDEIDSDVSRALLQSTDQIQEFSL